MCLAQQVQEEGKRAPLAPSPPLATALYLHDYIQFCKSFKIKLQFILMIQYTDFKRCSMVNQVSSVGFDNKSLHNETNFNKFKFTEKFCEFINLIINRQWAQ